VSVYACRPFSFVEGTGFHQLAAKLISVGATLGKVNVNEVCVLLCIIDVKRR